ncbi:hypothetical protein [Prevotella amnii]|uniref:Uncharacterized protein n=1 Tax=Prevotella amnii DNF00058 TaxID=1401066 RepID=A0A096CCU5_9BACT|nr:hypothetical protein [Prevotella amnii]KGF52732.1 hypothetical protein HMPREF9302_02450 [Prevotella amnii DNF00058]
MKDWHNKATLLNDFQHKVENKIKRLDGTPGFPVRGAKVSEEELSDYLFFYQAALDYSGSERTQYTIAGGLMVLPILIISAFPDKNLPFKGILNVIFAVVIGLILFAFYRIIVSIIIKNKIRKLKSTYPEARRYVDEVLSFEA